MSNEGLEHQNESSAVISEDARRALDRLKKQLANGEIDRHEEMDEEPLAEEESPEEDDEGGGLFDWFSEKYEGAKEVANEAATDIEELAVLADDFKDLIEVQLYFEDNREELESIGAIDLFKDPESVQKKIDEVSKMIEQANRAVQEIQKTNLRFSDDYLGETIKMTQDSLDGMNGYFGNLFHEITDPSTFKGRIARKLMPKEKYKKMTKVSLALKKAKETVFELKGGLDSLIDPDEREASNNDFLNPLLKAKESVDEKRKSYKRLKEIAEALQKLKRMKEKFDNFF